MALIKNYYTLYIVFVFVLVGCDTSSLDSKESFFKWMGDKKNGFIKETSANNFSLRMKYLPPEYLAMNEVSSIRGSGLENYNSFLEEFKNTRTFLLSIKHKNAGVDITNYNVADMQDYRRRIADLNFRIKETVRLKIANGTEFSPVLSTIENTYEIGGLKSIYLVFSDKSGEVLNSNTLDIVFNGGFLDTGISHFVFKKEAIENIPTLTFIN